MKFFSRLENAGWTFQLSRFLFKFLLFALMKFNDLMLLNNIKSSFIMLKSSWF